MNVAVNHVARWPFTNHRTQEQVMMEAMMVQVAGFRGLETLLPAELTALRELTLARADGVTWGKILNRLQDRADAVGFALRIKTTTPAQIFQDLVRVIVMEGWA